jgi:virulence-associated protein VagC
MADSARDGRETIIFQSGNSAAVRLIGDCKLPKGTRVRLRRDGANIVIEPIKKEWSKKFLATFGSYKGEIPRPPPEVHQRNPFDIPPPAPKPNVKAKTKSRRAR